MTERDDLEEWQLSLSRMLTEDGWQKGLRPALEIELAKQRRHLETAHFSELSEVKGVQTQIRFLRKLLEDPKAFCKERRVA